MFEVGSAGEVASRTILRGSEESPFEGDEREQFCRLTCGGVFGGEHELMLCLLRLIGARESGRQRDPIHPREHAVVALQARPEQRRGSRPGVGVVLPRPRKGVGARAQSAKPPRRAAIHEATDKSMAFQHRCWGIVRQDDDDSASVWTFRMCRSEHSDVVHDVVQP